MPTLNALRCLFAFTLLLTSCMPFEDSSSYRLDLADQGDELGPTCAPGEHDGGDGQCVPKATCSPGFHDNGDGRCVGGARCASEYSFCAGACVSLDSNQHCGTCDRSCGPNQSCVSGDCVCEPPWASCSKEGDECTVNTDDDPNHCGRCKRACSPNETCVKGECVCEASLVNCDGQCVDLNGDVGHCGECGKACGHNELCVNRHCVCQPEFANCDEEAGCETWIIDDVNHCGVCGQRCESNEFCTNASCMPCTEVCEGRCVDLKTDDAHCGGCEHPCTNEGHCFNGSCRCAEGWEGDSCELPICTVPCMNGGSCTAPETCICLTGWDGPQCQCPAGSTWCDGDCVDVTTNREHCGACGVPCLDGQLCAGTCIPRPWTSLPSPEQQGVQTFALAEWDETLVLASVSNDTEARVEVQKLAGSNAWTPLGDKLNSTQAHAIVDLQVEAGTLYALYSELPTEMPERSHHVKKWSPGEWVQIALPGYEPPCGPHLDSVLAIASGAPTIATLSEGAPPCLGAVSVGQWRSNAWSPTPNPDHPGVVSLGCHGNVDLAWDQSANRPLLALTQAGDHQVLQFNTATQSFTALGAELNLNPKSADALDRLSLTVGPQPTIAYTETVSSTRTLFVKVFDGAWKELGPDPVYPGANCSSPSLTYINGVPYVAFIANPDPNDFGELRVRRYKGQWEDVGVTDELLVRAPQLIGVDGIPHVAFLTHEDKPRVNLKHFPPL